MSPSDKFRVMLALWTPDSRIPIPTASTLMQALSDPRYDVTPTILSAPVAMEDLANRALTMAYTAGYDFLVFVNAEVRWTAQDLFSLLDLPDSFVGAALPGNDEGTPPSYALVDGAELVDSAVLKAEFVSRDFLKLARPALSRLVKAEVEERGLPKDQVFRLFMPRYDSEGQYLNGEQALCRKWRDLGNEVFATFGLSCGRPVVMVNHPLPPIKEVV